MNEFKISVITPVYNVESYLRETIDSVIQQDLGFKFIQLILVDDGSTDGSPEICDEYKSKYPNNIEVIHKINGGVSEARNYGLKLAKGKYLNFLDSDDKLKKDCLRLCFNFFEKHEDEIDVCCMSIYMFDRQNGRHWDSDKFKKGTRVVNLNDDPVISQKFVNSTLIHRRVQSKINFDSRLSVGEDFKVLYELFIDRPYLGIVNEAVYFYRKRSNGSLSAIDAAGKDKNYYFNFFNYLIDYIFDKYEQKFGFIPDYVQTVFARDIQFRIKCYESNSVLVENGTLTNSEFEEYKKRLSNILHKIDDHILLKYTSQLYFEELVNLFRLKYGDNLKLIKESSWSFIATPSFLKIRHIGTGLTIIDFIRFTKNELVIEGRQCCPVINNVLWQFVAVLGKEDYIVDFYGIESERKILNKIFCYVYYFRVKIPLAKIKKGTSYLNFDIKANEYRSHLNHISYNKFSHLSNEATFIRYYAHGIRFKVKDRGCKIELRKGSFIDKYFNETKNNFKLFKRGFIEFSIIRLLAAFIKTFKRKQIWIISDRQFKADDNGEVFFEYLNKNCHHNIKSYFAISKDSPDFYRLKKIGRVVDNQSIFYRIIFLCSDYIISSQADECVINPFLRDSIYFQDLMNSKNIFLQHGITFCDLSNWLRRKNKNLFGFITVAQCEYKSILSGNYDYCNKNVWLTGFCRFDRLYKTNDKIITFMPTWRSWLVNYKAEDENITLKDFFFESSYYLFYKKLFSDVRLFEAAKQFGFKLIYRPHPLMKKTADFIIDSQSYVVPDLDSKYVDLYAKSSLIVTDYSSSISDFVYLYSPVIYVQFDKEEFFSGKHTYTQGYFNYENDGFGEVEYEYECILRRIIEYMSNGCVMKEKYRKRVDDFFFYHDKNNCKRVFDKIISLSIDD